MRGDETAPAIYAATQTRPTTQTRRFTGDRGKQRGNALPDWDHDYQELYNREKALNPQSYRFPSGPPGDINMTNDGHTTADMASDNYIQRAGQGSTRPRAGPGDIDEDSRVIIDDSPIDPALLAMSGTTAIHTSGFRFRHCGGRFTGQHRSHSAGYPRCTNKPGDDDYIDEITVSLSAQEKS
jgi:hypothetical protein